MTVTVEIPDSVATDVVPEGADAARKILEDAVRRLIGRRGSRPS